MNWLLVRSYGCGKYINMKGIVLVLCGVLAVMLLCFFLYEHLILRYCIIGVLAAVALIVLYKYRRTVIKLVRTKILKKKNK